MKRKKIAWAVASAAVFCLLLAGATWVMRPRLFANIDHFYRLPKNTADVMFFGSSNAYTNINPAQLYAEHGIAADILAGSGQNIWNSYYYLEEAYKTQSPKVVVLEIYNSYRTYEFDALENAVTNTLGIRSLLTRFTSVRASVPAQQVTDVMLGWPVYHSRYRDLGKGVCAFFAEDDGNGAIRLGQYPVFLTKSFDTPVPDASTLPIPAKIKEYLDRFIALARAHGSRIVLVKTPCVLPAESTGVYNAIRDYVSGESDISFLNLNDDAQQMGFNYSTDLQDIVHCNMMGNRKVTAFLGSWLAQNTALPDRRGDSGWCLWDSYAELWQRTGFLYPENMTFGPSQLAADTAFAPTADAPVFSTSVDVKKGKWYLLTGTLTAQRAGYLTVDLYAPSDFFVARYTRVIQVEAGESQLRAAFHLLDDVPDDLSMRIISTDGALTSVDSLSFAQQSS